MKTKVLISFVVTAKLICVFIFALAIIRFSHDAAHIYPSAEGSIELWFRGRVVCALDYEAGDPGSIPGSCGTTDWLFRTGW